MMPRFAGLPILLLLPFVLRGGRVLALHAVRERRLSWLLAPIVSVACWLLAIHALGLVTQSFYIGLFGGSVIVALLGFASGWLPGPDSEDGPPISPWMFVGALCVMAVLLGPELTHAEHDECVVAGHISFPQQLLNGIYPPRHLVYPQFELRYHYGFDLLSASIAAVLGRPDMLLLVHTLTLLLFGYAFCLFWALGQRWIGGRFAGPVTGITVMLAGGFPFLCRALHPLGSLLIGDCLPNGMWLIPPVTSTFLQHPWSLGYPLAAAILLVFHLRRSSDPWWFLALTLLFLFLSLSQFVLFLALLAAAFATGCFERGQFSSAECLRMIGMAAVVVLLARHMHGFFAQVAEPAQTQLEFHVFPLDKGWLAWTAWMLQSFGFLLPLGIAGFFLWSGERFMLALLIIGGLTIFNLSRHPNSWDIVKFAQLSQLALAILSAATLQRLLSVRRLRVFGAVGLVLVAAFGVSWPTAVALDLKGLFFCKSLPAAPNPTDREAIDYLRGHIAAGELVFRSHNPQAYAIYGGLPEPMTDWAVGSFGFSKALERQRAWLMARPSADPTDYLNQSFRWFVIDDDETPMSQLLNSWVSEGRAEQRAEFPPLRIYYLTR
jgi:hypothetical protein